MKNQLKSMFWWNRSTPYELTAISSFNKTYNLTAQITPFLPLYNLGSNFFLNCTSVATAARQPGGWQAASL
jgi:hypothetical protein